MDWSDWFHAHMRMPGTIEKSILLLGSSALAEDTEEKFLDDEAVKRVWQETKPKDSVVVNGSKYLYIRDIIEGHDGYSISLYQKVKSDLSNDDEPNILFSARMDTLLWVGNFNNKNITTVVPFVESIAMHVFSHMVQSEE